MNDKIVPFSYRRLPDKKKAFPLFFSLLFPSCILFIVSMNISKYAGVMSLLSVVGLTASMLVYIRYVTSDYSYSVGPGENSEAFLIFTKLVGKRRSMMGCVPLYAVKSIEKLAYSDLKNHKRLKNVRRYNFAPTFMPSEIYFLKAQFGTESYEVVLEASDDFSARILEYARYAVLDRSEHDGEDEE